VSAPLRAADFDALHYSVIELETLLARYQGPSVDALAAILAIHPRPSGASEPDNAAELVGRILGRAHRWTHLASSGTHDTGLLVESTHGTLIARREQSDSWSVILIDPDAAVGRLISQTALAYARAGDPTTVVVRTATIDDSRTFTISRQLGDWAFSSGGTDAAAPELVRENATADEVDEHLCAFIASWPAPLEH